MLEPVSQSRAGRAAHCDDVEALMVAWCAARPSADAVAALTAAQVAVGSFMDMADIAVDAHFREREIIADVGRTPMPALIARLSATPGRLGWPGRDLDADGDAISQRSWAPPD